MSDDPYATPAAVRRALGYYSGAPRRRVELTPAELGFASVGHFDLFHDRHRDGFWAQTLAWLCSEREPWPVAERWAASPAAGAPAHR